MPRNLTVASFDPRLLEIFRLASIIDGGWQSPPMPNNTATSLRHRLYSLRKAMRLEDHPSLPLAEQATVHFRTIDPNHKTVRVQVGDALLSEYLPDLPDDLLDLDPPATTPSPPMHLPDFDTEDPLSTFMGRTTDKK